ncbi:leucine-rich repeat extensin-like protein 3 [Balamuthia mandrillaris]
MIFKCQAFLCRHLIDNALQRPELISAQLLKDNIDNYNSKIEPHPLIGTHTPKPKSSFLTITGLFTALKQTNLTLYSKEESLSDRLLNNGVPFPALYAGHMAALTRTPIQSPYKEQLLAAHAWIPLQRRDSSSVFYNPNDPANIIYRTPNDQTSFNAELTAILLAVKSNNSLPITIFSDNLSCINALKNRNPTTPRGRKEHPILKLIDIAILEREATVDFQHIYSHQKEKLKKQKNTWKKKITHQDKVLSTLTDPAIIKQGNEQADKLASQAPQLPSRPLIEELCLSPTEYLIKDNTQQKFWTHNTRKTVKATLPKETAPNKKPNRFIQLPYLPIDTEHVRFCAHHNLLPLCANVYSPTASKPLYQSPTCKLCPPNSTEEEDLTHMVCHCPALSKTRERLHQDLKDINPNLARLFIDNLENTDIWLGALPHQVSLHLTNKEKRKQVLDSLYKIANALQNFYCTRNKALTEKGWLLPRPLPPEPPPPPSPLSSSPTTASPPNSLTTPTGPTPTKPTASQLPTRPTDPPNHLIGRHQDNTPQCITIHKDACPTKTLTYTPRNPHTQTKPKGMLSTTPPKSLPG